MADSKIVPAEEKTLVNTLSSFTREELTRFRDYALKSYLNKKGPLIEFLDVLLPIINEGKTPTASQMLKLALKTARLGTAAYSALFADLTRLVNGFIQNERYREKPEQAVTDLLTAVNAKRLNKLFEINMSLAKKISSNVSNRSTSDYLREFIIASETDFHDQILKATKHKENAHQLSARLDAFFITNKLRLYCASRQHKHTTQADIDIEQIAEMAAEKRFADMPAVQVYLSVYHLQAGNEEDGNHFLHLKKLLKTHQRDLPDVVLRDANVFAINYCVQQVNKGKFNYLNEVYDLYKTALDRKFLYDESELAPWDYSKIIALGLQLKNYKWSEKFIELYKERIPTADKKMNVVTFNMAKMYFFSKRYKDVLMLLEGVKSDEMMYVLGMNTLLIKTCYEMNEPDRMHKLLREFKALLTRRKKIDAQEKKSHLAFIEYTISLAGLNRKNRSGLRDLKKEISSQTEITEREWLLEKIGSK